jgi:uncharacterized membrane protein
MIEGTLQEVIELLKENGGRAKRKDNSKEEWLKNAFEALFSIEDVLASWIYEPPKQSAFYTWNKSAVLKIGQISTEVNRDSQGCAFRKEGWNAAIHAALLIMMDLIENKPGSILQEKMTRTAFKLTEELKEK